MFAGALFVIATIVLTVYGQMILKWRLDQLGPLPEGAFPALFFLVRQLFDPWIFSSFFSAFIASLAWMAALTKFQLSSVYPFMSLSFPLVVVLSGPLLGEIVNPTKFAGVVVICIGLVMVSR